MTYEKLSQMETEEFIMRYKILLEQANEEAKAMEKAG